MTEPRHLSSVLHNHVGIDGGSIILGISTAKFISNSIGTIKSIVNTCYRG